MSSFVCPVDGTTLVPIERQGIEIDHCPSCRGVWLDRGELDKIIERSAVQAAPAPEPRVELRPRYDDRRQGEYRHKRKKSFFEELFD
jgi:uncharacterized protein